MSEAVCRAGLCGRAGEFTWHGIDVCWEHHQVMVDIQAAREIRDHANGLCSCSVHEPVEACRIGQQEVRDRRAR